MLSARIAAAQVGKFRNVCTGVNNVSVSHERIDQRSIAMHRAIAEKLRANPALLEIAHENITRWAPTAGRSRHYLDAWREVLEMPLEEMRAMRQNNPFAGVLDARERWAIYDLFPMERI